MVKRVCVHVYVTSLLVYPANRYQGNACDIHEKAQGT